MPEDYVLFHAISSEIQVTVLQAQDLFDRTFAVDLERWGIGGVQYFDAGGPDFDAAGWKIWILVALGSQGDFAFYRDGPFRAKSFRVGENFRVIGIEGHLSDPPTISEVYEDQTPVIASSTDPSCQSHLIASIFGAQGSGVMGPVRVAVKNAA
jgi:hypothetical protein